MRPRNPLTHCTCTKTKCIKKYCVCFQFSRACTDKCFCKNCCNLQENYINGIFVANNCTSNEENSILEVSEPKPKRKYTKRKNDRATSKIELDTLVDPNFSAKMHKLNSAIQNKLMISSSIAPTVSTVLPSNSIVKEEQTKKLDVLPEQLNTRTPVELVGIRQIDATEVIDSVLGHLINVAEECENLKMTDDCIEAAIQGEFGLILKGFNESFFPKHLDFLHHSMVDEPKSLEKPMTGDISKSISSADHSMAVMKRSELYTTFNNHSKNDLPFLMNEDSGFSETTYDSRPDAFDLYSDKSEIEMEVETLEDDFISEDSEIEMEVERLEDDFISEDSEIEMEVETLEDDFISEDSEIEMVVETLEDDFELDENVF